MTSTPAPRPAPPAEAADPDRPAAAPSGPTPLAVVPDSPGPVSPPAAAGRWWNRAQPAPRGWSDRSQRYVTWPWFVARTAGEGLLLALFTVADLVLIKSTFDTVIGGSELASWLVALTMALLGAVTALKAGQHMRMHVATRETSRTGPLLLLATWVFLGGVLFWLRWNAAALDVALTFEGEAATDAGSGHHLMAVALAGAHLATGALAFASAWSLTNPEAYGLRTVAWMHRKVLRLLPPAEALVTRLAHNLGARVTEVAEATRAMENAQEVRRAVAAHVQAAARVRIAQHLGDPAATGVIRQVADVPIELPALERPPAGSQP